jgi:hypothetical protein
LEKKGCVSVNSLTGFIFSFFAGETTTSIFISLVWTFKINAFSNKSLGDDFNHNKFKAL